MRKNVLAAIIIAAAWTGVGCGGNKSADTPAEGTVNTEAVNNPATAEGGEATGDVAKFEFEKDVHDFGEIMQGEKVAYSFKFKNSGNADLLITSARGSCGCTVPEYPKEPIAPGAEAKIDVIFDSAGKEGQQNKKVTIVANTVPSTTVISINGNVIAPKK
jgi:hypothetical protein